MNNFIICPCCGQWLEIQDIGFYTYAFPMPLNVRDVVMSTNTQDFLNSLQLNFEDFRFNSQATQCILDEEESNNV